MGDKTTDTATITNIKEQHQEKQQQQHQQQQQQLSNNSNNSKARETYTCDFCSMTFPEISSLNDHQEDCSKQKELLKRYLNGSITFMVID